MSATYAETVLFRRPANRHQGLKAFSPAPSGAGPFMSNKTKASQEATQNDSNVTENAAGSRTVTASNHFGQFNYTGSAEVSAETFAILANEGFEGRLVAASAKLDAFKEFGNFGHKGADGKTVERSKSYKRGEVKFSPELAELVRQHLEGFTKTFAEVTIPVTVSRYESSAVKAVTVDQAGLIVAKNAITKRNDNPQELDKLAKMVEFSYSATSELTVENAAFVTKVASFYANL